MFCCSSLFRICILVNLTCSSKRGVLSNPFFFASSDMAINPGRTPASCFRNCGVRLGASALASFSSSALVMTVLQSAGALAARVFAAAAGLAALPGAAALGLAGHTPITVITGAPGGIAAEVSTGAAGLAATPGCVGGRAAGAACPQARVPSKTHSIQRLLINRLLRGLVHQKVD